MTDPDNHAHRRSLSCLAPTDPALLSIVSSGQYLANYALDSPIICFRAEEPALSCVGDSPEGKGREMLLEKGAPVLAAAMPVTALRSNLVFSGADTCVRD